MKKILLTALIATGLLTATISQATLTLNLANVGGSVIQFGPGSSFDFTPGGGVAQWSITSTTDGTGSANGLNGYFAGGPWTIGAITTTDLGGGNSMQQAPVANKVGSTINIIDGANLLTGTINWIQIQTVDMGGVINSGGSINVTGITYGGANADLQTLASGGAEGSVILSFQFIGNPAISDKMLSDLTSGGTYTTSYSGSIAAVPEPTTVIAGALVLLPLGASAVRILRRNRMS